MGKRGPYVVKGEVQSEKYPGYWLKPDGSYRLSCYRPNGGGEPKLYSRYFHEVACDACGRLHLKDYANMKARRKKNRPNTAYGTAWRPHSRRARSPLSHRVSRAASSDGSRKATCQSRTSR